MNTDKDTNIYIFEVDEPKHTHNPITKHPIVVNQAYGQLDFLSNVLKSRDFFIHV